jgi:hypothetical protein
MVIFIELLISPETTLKEEDISSRLKFPIAVIGLLVMTALDFVFMFEIGNVEGGSPCLWFIIGGLLDLQFIETLPLINKWLLLFPIKILGDIALIIIPALIAKKFYKAKKEDVLLWAKVYCYILTILDMFLVISMLPAVIGGASGRALIITNLLSFLVFGANILIFTNAYRCCFNLSFEKAYYGWFFPVVAGIIILSVLFTIIP